MVIVDPGVKFILAATRPAQQMQLRHCTRFPRIYMYVFSETPIAIVTDIALTTSVTRPPKSFHLPVNRPLNSNLNVPRYL